MNMAVEADQFLQKWKDVSGCFTLLCLTMWKGYVESWPRLV